ncbi:MAG: DNA-processing protein DprA, partial [Acidimicrobiales bacterium]
MSSPELGELPEAAWASALLALEAMGPARLRALLELGQPGEIWMRLRDGGPISIPRTSEETVSKWRNAARRLDVHVAWSAMAGLGIVACTRGEHGYPTRLVDDIEPPEVLFRLGVAVGSEPTVAIVGTRSCTSYGRRAAFELGAGLAEAGVRVVSGLALGIDAAAHEGALSVSGASPVGVVGSGLDVVYPRRNRALWHRVVERGTLLSESPAGVGPEPWKFPARNRIIAGLADAVVVVESHPRGGALLTVDEAQLRGVDVGVVPGPITSPASAGTNKLLVDGAMPVVCLEDVLGLIGHVHP